MDPFLAHRRLTAAATGTAQAIATMRHMHLVPEPLVLCAYHLAGDPGAPLGLIYGTDRDAPKTIVVGEPRNRDLRFRALERLATDVNNYLDCYRTRSTVRDHHGRPKQSRAGNPQRLADDAPQIIVPNIGTVDWIGILARSTVWLRTDGDFPVDPVLPRFGGHLTHLTGRRAVAGSANLVAATEFLDVHWTTGQTDFEDANLATLLAWVDPHWLDSAWLSRGVTITDAVTAAAFAETLPSAGPASDPTWDEEELGALIAAYNKARKRKRLTKGPKKALRDAITEQLLPAWKATWRAIDLVMALPEAPGAQRRWLGDRWAWTSHLNRVDADRAFFRRYRTAIQSARLLAASEDAAAAVQADMAFDDPLVMARHVAAGAAIEGTVTGRDDDHRVRSPAGRRNRHPLIYVRCDEDVLLPVGTELTWVADTRIRGVISELPKTPADDLTIMVTAGMRTGALPGPADHGCFASFRPPTRYPDTMPDNVPWTHVLPAPPDPESDAA